MNMEHVIKIQSKELPENIDINYIKFYGRTSQPNMSMIPLVNINEEFRFYPYSHNYLVSNYGKVYNYLRGYFMKPCPDKDGYLRYFIDGKEKKAHRLVAYTFLPVDSPYYGLEVNHINGNKGDNRACNLEWCSVEYNNMQAMLLNQKASSTNIRAAKPEYYRRFTKEEIWKICEVLDYYKGNITPKEIAHLTRIQYDKKFPNLIRNIRKRATWVGISSNFNNIPYPDPSNKLYTK